MSLLYWSYTIIIYDLYLPGDNFLYNSQEDPTLISSASERKFSLPEI